MTTNYIKLKTNLRLCIQRLKMAEKKKTETTQKSRKEIGEYLKSGKFERAKIRVEHIIREDYLVEAMELVEMYCDLLLTRFGLIQQMKTLDEGLSEAISSLIWASPRLQSDISEIKIVSELLTQKYGKLYAQAARENSLSTVSPDLIAKMSNAAPPKLLVEKYLIEFAKSLNIPYTPDEEIMNNKNNVDGNGDTKTSNLIDFNCETIFPPTMTPSISGEFKDPHIVRPIGFDLDSSDSPNHKNKLKFMNKLSIDDINNEIPEFPPPAYSAAIKSKNDKPRPTPAPRNFINQNNSENLNLPEVPKTLPSTTLPDNENSNDLNNEEIDFDDLAKRFEALKNRK